MIPTLETQRLRLRAFTLADAPHVQRIAGVAAVADPTLVIPHPYLDGMAEAWIATHEERFVAGESVTFAITDQRDDSLIGAIALDSMKAGHQAELGYWIGEPYWGRGYCTEAAEAVLRHAFSLDLVRVHAAALTSNPASGRVLQKIGMRHEGRRLKHASNRRRHEDIELYGILREDMK